MTLTRPLRAAALPAALIAVSYFFFLDYLPPLRALYIPFDLEGYHYSLCDYAFQALRSGRFPLWDSTQYCGIPFAANIQAALFYPPLWLLYLISLRHPHLPFLGLEILTLAHVPLAFFLCYRWLSRRALAPLPSALGAGVFAFSGYMLLQLQHLGLVCGYAWLPLALSSIDASVQARRLRPLWPLAAASALCFLAGYPPFWVVFASLVLAYSLACPRPLTTASATLAALALSLCLSLVQLLPAAEAAARKRTVLSYGGGFHELKFYVSYIAPNFFNFSLRADVHTNFGYEYLYLGAPALFGLACLAARPRFRDLLPILSLAFATFLFAANPFNFVSTLLARSAFLGHLVRSYYFLAGFTLAAAALSAHGLDAFLRRPSRPTPRTLALISAASLLAWSAYLLSASSLHGPGFPSGPASLADSASLAALSALAFFTLRGHSGPLRSLLAAAILLSAACEYRAFGAAKRFNAAPGRTSPFDASAFPALNPAALTQLRSNPAFRIALDPLGAPQPWELRHFNLPTPQGDDPVLSRSYSALLTPLSEFRPPWSFVLDPSNPAALRLLGVRYFISSSDGPQLPLLESSSSFHSLAPSADYYQVFSLDHPQPAYSLDPPTPASSITCLTWLPESRSFRLHASTPSRLRLAEQFYSGWHATIDGSPTPIEPWSTAFQSVALPPGDHTVVFRYSPASLPIGALGTLASLALLASALFRTRPRRVLAHRLPAQPGKSAPPSGTAGKCRPARQA